MRRDGKGSKVSSVESKLERPLMLMLFDECSYAVTILSQTPDFETQKSWYGEHCSAQLLFSRWFFGPIE